MIRLTSPVFALSLFLAGCPAGDDDDDAAGLDEAFSAVVLHGPFSGDATLTATSSAGVPYSEVDPLGLAGTDWAVGDGNDDFWLIGRLGTDVVRRYSWPDTSAPSLEFAAGTPTNPQVAVECAGSIFLTRYGLGVQGGGGDVAVFGLDGSPDGRVDLSSFAEGTDGTPEPSTMVELDGTLYVGLERYDRDAGWVVDPVGKVVAIDCASREVVESWDTVPNAHVFAWENTVYVRGDGGVQELDSGTNTFVDRVLEEDLGGEAIVVLAPTPDAWVVVSEHPDDGANTVWCLEPGGALTSLEASPSRAWDAAVDPAGNAWISWRDHWATSEIDPGGLGVYDGTSCERTAMLDFGSDPFDVAFTGLP
ncbi:MAG: hypothetical protein KDA24_14680 [Deltaproteobacteria bacterium]|nr:hypothetical protein [Deltaproteobacteria bacterium]